MEKMLYFFDIEDRIRGGDQIGSEFPDMDAARQQAISFAGELLISEPWHLQSGEMKVLVHNRDHSEAFRITISIDTISE